MCIRDSPSLPARERNEVAKLDLLSNHSMSGKEVAEKLGISAAVAYANKNQVQKLIKEEIEVLESGA